MDEHYFFNFNKLDYIKGKKPSDCILCLIRDRDARIVDLSIYRDRYFLVTVNLYPYNPGHLLIFPARHIEDIRELTSKEEHRLCKLNNVMLDVLDRSYSPHGYNIGYNMGLVAGASIKHLHLHIIPRYPGETGIADLIGGKRVLVEDPKTTVERLKESISHDSLSISSS